MILSEIRLVGVIETKENEKNQFFCWKSSGRGIYFFFDSIYFRENDFYSRAFFYFCALKATFVKQDTNFAAKDGTCVG